MLGKDWRSYEATPLHIKIGDLAGAVIDFGIIAFILFIVVVKLMGKLRKPQAATTRTCPECLESIPIEARRCKACGQASQPSAASVTG
jgi:large conductance mechanosensitive channel